MVTNSILRDKPSNKVFVSASSVWYPITENVDLVSKPKRRENKRRANKRLADEEEEEVKGVAKDAGSRIEESRLRVFGERIRLSFDDSAGSWFEDTVDVSLVPSAMYISQNQIGSKVHSPNSPSSSKEVRTGKIH